ncbi:hypothetical protein N1851_033358 [Merluccius polli]|uniref:Uncharacterized protein n=1 Tax=Merluccius polli TaxID=89951 RepID=A0AA47M1N1_MERPO|nr:hypothetical protein N1851_033358 [Merluccius polli]
MLGFSGTMTLSPYSKGHHLMAHFHRHGTARRGTARHGIVLFGSVSITTEYHIVPPRRGRGRHNTAAQNCRDVIYTAPSHAQNRKTRTTKTNNTTMEDTEALVYLLLKLWLFVTHKAKEESQRRLQAARQNTVQKYIRVLEAIQQHEALDEQTRATKRRRLTVS